MPSASEETDDAVSFTATPSGKWQNTSPWISKPKKYDQEFISPLMLGKNKEVEDFDLDNTSRSHRSMMKKKFSSGSVSASTSPILRHTSRRKRMDSKEGHNLELGSPALHDQNTTSNHSSNHAQTMDKVIDEVVAWLQAEKAKQKARRAERRSDKQRKNRNKASNAGNTFQTGSPSRSRRSSESSEDAIDLEELESILEKNIGPVSRRPQSRRASWNLRRYGSRSSQSHRRLSMYKSSDTEFADDDPIIPSCDVVLDNSKTLGSRDIPSSAESTACFDFFTSKESDPWPPFKQEILRLAQTLRLKGWSQVPVENSSEIGVERLSGALTNAVYVVTPPQNLVSMRGETRNGKKRKQPLKLLLRIYGPNVEHLIDREGELLILKRLARKQIGPRLLGTFRNGRFEEYLNARPLNPQEMRDPETSKQIAKRMRELHDGIELLAHERLGGPFVWKNWDKWVKRAEDVANRVDSFLRQRKGFSSQRDSFWDKHEFVCGMPWPFFRDTVERYRRELDSSYGSKMKLREQLVFAHNDTQYGNILRLEPPGESPLLLPANRHKQLVVIDFEYSNANVPGFEFANHFTEWCYNYHDPTHSYACNASHYPTPEEQYRFMEAYVLHQPEHTPNASATPRFTPMHSNPSITSLSSISSLTLDGGRRRSSMYNNQFGDALSTSTTQNSEPNSNYNAEIERLTQEVRVWRIANSAQWVVWGILQATVPDESKLESGGWEALTTPEPEEHFDYLSYARERAMFFWGDCLQAGLVEEGDLGKELMKEIKIVKY